MERNDTLTIRRAAEANRLQALWLVFSRLPAQQCAAQVASTIAAAADPETAFSDLLIAQRGKRMVAAAWVQPAPGRTAIVWPPQLIAGEPEATATALFQEVDARLAVGHVELAQAIQQTDEEETSDRLQRHGFQLAARLLFLVCDVQTIGDVAPTGPLDASCDQHRQPLEFEPFEEFKTDRLAELVERTYVGTQDVPLLNNLRSINDVLDGYRHAGTYDPRHWLFVRSSGRDVGCLILTDHPDSDQFELIYMGVVPEARGQGFGKRIAEHAKRRTHLAGRPRLILGVDADNRPALDSYTAAGFQRREERQVFIRSLIK